jgi:hypothetical protein
MIQRYLAGSIVAIALWNLIADLHLVSTALRDYGASEKEVKEIFKKVC